MVVSTKVKSDKRSKGEKTSLELARILTKTLKRRGKKDKKDKKDRKKKKKKKKKGGGDSSPLSSNGESSNSSRSSKSSSEEVKESDSEDDMDPPLRRKARARPGSVLSMLVEHAKEQLDQSSVVAIPDGSDQKVTQGVKLTSYFQILLKAKLVGAMAQQREMHHLSICMDLLRGGKLSTLGDALAARFLSLHQSVLDGNWVAARHMELYPLEESIAAGASIILKTRKQCQVGCKSARIRLRELRQRLWPWSRRKRQIRLLEPRWRRKRQERERPERKRPRSRQEQLVEGWSWKRRRLEGESGDKAGSVCRSPCRGHTTGRFGL